MYRDVSPTYTELHSAHVNLQTTQGRSDLGTKSFTLITFLILKEENTSLIFKLLQYVLINVRSFRGAKLEKGRYGSLK